LKAGDVITHITPESCAGGACAARTIATGDDLRTATSELAGQKISVVYIRDNKKEQPEVTTVELSSLQAVEESKLANKACIEAGEADCPLVKGYLGVSPSDYIKQRSTWSAPIVGVALTGQFFWETLKGIGGIIGDLFSGNAAVAGEQVTGVVGIGYVLSELSSQGFMSVLFLTAIISVSLAVMNVLPIPALDGGRLFVTLLFRTLGLPLSKRTEERIHGTGFALLMVLFVLITVLDVKKFIL
jgi:RIP metalloprotease RseP